VCFPKEVTVKDDVLEGEATVTVRACGVIPGSGSEVVQIVRMEGMASDELETRGL